MFQFGFENDLSSKERVASHDTPLPFKVIPSDAAPLDSVQHDLVPITSELNIRKSIANVPSHLSPSGADIVPNTYEGGYKLWECAVDLCQHVATLDLKGKTVLELGAGHALPAIVAAKQGAETVHVQDYNEEVIQQVSIPNVTANADVSHFSFFAGAWHKLAQVLDTSYDVILTADTVYAPAQVVQLAQCIAEVLGENGVAYVAAKRYYFGLGGGTLEFVRQVQEEFAKRDMKVKVVTAKEIRDGVSNVREIVELHRC